MGSKPNIAKLIQGMAVVTALLLSFSVARAQEAQELPLHPGSIIKLELTFHGPGADKLKVVYSSMQLQTPKQPDQAGFMTSIPGDFKIVSPGVFDGEFTVPDTATSGEYSLQDLDIRGDGIQLGYHNGQQYSLHNFRVDNPKRFSEPPVTIKLISSGPVARGAAPQMLMTMP